jgi:hypothetical protein
MPKHVSQETFSKQTAAPVIVRGGCSAQSAVRQLGADKQSGSFAQKVLFGYFFFQEKVS